MDREELEARIRLQSINPDDGKYFKGNMSLYLSSGAEWLACAHVQLKLLETRQEFGLATKEQVEEVYQAIAENVDPLSMQRLERAIKHDQLAVIEEIGSHIHEKTKALLHPGTTSYDILDTARSYLFQSCWKREMSPVVGKVITSLCDLSETYMDVLQAGRTHLQRTSPVPFGATLAGYAMRLAQRMVKCDKDFGSLRGKISGIVGTGASIGAVIGKDRSVEFERAVLEKLGLRPDTTATQIVQKESLADVGHSLTTLMYVLGDLANDMRLLYSSEISEVTSRDNAKRLGGSSADASKNNPINWENIAGKVPVVESGMRVLYGLITSDLQRDLRSSVQARYQPQGMMCEVYESFCRAHKALGQLSVNEDRMAENLQAVRNFPSEAMTAITRAHGWIHPEYGIGHDTVKEFSKKAKKEGTDLLQVALEDEAFHDLYSHSLSDKERRILQGELELYLGHSKERARDNIQKARQIVRTYQNL